MGWSPWASESNRGSKDSKKDEETWLDALGLTDTRTLVSTLILTSCTLGAVRVYRSYLRRIPGSANIRPDAFRRRSMFGTVTSVGDGDNFRLFHTPGGRLTGWGWLPGRNIPTTRDELKDRTLHVRIAGVDAPELAHFGRPSQPGSQEALNWLKDYILHRRVRAYIYRRDQYERVVSTVYVRRGLLRKDVGLEMLRRGLATVYEAKTGAEFGSVENKYRRAEWWAKTRRKGIWKANKSDFESPREYKTRQGAAEAPKER